MGELFIPPEPDLSSITPFFTASSEPESAQTTAIIKALGLESHIEGGYFLQTDASLTTMPSPYPPEALSEETIALAGGIRPDFNPQTERRLSTTIHYFITPRTPLGSFHRNRSRIIHSLHRGRGRYMLIHPDGRIESFIVGQDVAKGERLQWVVEGGVWKASFLLPEDGKESEGLLITETVVPGFEYVDHEFLSMEKLEKMMPKEKVQKLAWLVRKGEHKEVESTGNGV